MKKVLVRLAVSDIHEEAYRQFRGLCVDVDGYEEYE